MIGTALQVFLNLGCLVEQVDIVIAKSTDIAEGLVKNAVDMKLLASGVTSNASAALWEQIEAYMNKLHDLCQKIFTLEKVLAKKRDPVTHKFFIEFFSEVSHFFVIY